LEELLELRNVRSSTRVFPSGVPMKHSRFYKRLLFDTVLAVVVGAICLGAAMAGYSKAAGLVLMIAVIYFLVVGFAEYRRLWNEWSDKR
jgi:hypothetical protein